MMCTSPFFDVLRQSVVKMSNTCFVTPIIPGAVSGSGKPHKAEYMKRSWRGCFVFAKYLCKSPDTELVY